jgi:hypothetical protein
MKRVLLELAAAAAAIVLATSAANAFECVDGTLNVAADPEIPCAMAPSSVDTGMGAATSGMMPSEVGAAPMGSISESGPATTGSIQPGVAVPSTPPPAMAEEATSPESCTPGGYWAKPEPGGAGSASVMMKCP